MKKLLGLLIVSGLLFSCGEEEAVETKSYSGNFLMYDGDAILEVNEVMYSITPDEMTEKLASAAKNSQKTEFDMVPVTIEAAVKAKPQNTEGWDSILTIKRIVEVKPTAVSPDIEIEETQQ